MSRSWKWRAVAGLYVIINGGGAIFAAAQGEQMHAAMHVALLLAGFAGYVLWRVAQWAGRKNVPPQLSDERINYLQQSVDAVALEVERLGEAQRFNEKLRAVQQEIPPPKKPTEG